MAGNFSNTTYVNTVNSLVDAANSKLVNPYYKFGDQKPTTVTYYAQNIEKSTLDDASGLYGAHVGNGSPFKFNKIKNFVLYGIDRITTDYDVGDYGTEAASITGDTIVLPNTITPRPGDFFSISYIKEPLLFKVNGVTPDTLDNGANIYKIEYALELTNAIESIEAQVVKEFTFNMDYVGTDLNCVIEDSTNELVGQVGTIIENLITYFYDIFFDSKLQTFTFLHNGYHMYDPYLIEFLIRNKVLNYGDEYIYVSHAASLYKTFSMDYLRTFFYWLENPTNKPNLTYIATADMITDPNSIFTTRMEYYYQIRYNDNSPYKTRFTTFSPELIGRIDSGEMYKEGTINEIYNKWIEYFNNGSSDIVAGDLLNVLQNAEYMDNMEFFYLIPITIFILKQSIASILS